MAKVPQITVKVKYGDEEISQCGAHFIDAISFLCAAEISLRRLNKLQTPVDEITIELGKENLEKLLGGKQ